MSNPVRPCARPPQIVRRPRRGPLAPLRGATPTKAALCWRVRVPHAGRSRSNVRAHTGPLPGALCHQSSWACQSALRRSSLSQALSSVARRGLRQVLWASRSVWIRPLVPARRFCSAGRLAISGWQRPRRARRACVWVSGSGRGVGRPAAAQGASARASHASVCASGPVARAQARAGRGLTTTTGQPAGANATGAARARPPVASSTMRAGCWACRRSTRIAMPSAWLGTAQRAPAGRRAMSHGAWATSIPTKPGGSLLGTPVCPPWQRRAPWPQTTGRACGGQDVTTRAPLRSRWTQAESVCHV